MSSSSKLERQIAHCGHISRSLSPTYSNNCSAGNGGGSFGGLVTKANKKRHALARKRHSQSKGIATMFSQVPSAASSPRRTTLLLAWSTHATWNTRNTATEQLANVNAVIAALPELSANRPRGEWQRRLKTQMPDTASRAKAKDSKVSTPMRMILGRPLCKNQAHIATLAKAKAAYSRSRKPSLWPSIARACRTSAAAEP
mmetsp:Transcript_74612/g.228313  ORF Transcript_74612/g.228313 Transcript_74612/m.228313 type:complete len:200 (-) Transcript_74612:94-693(-)